MKKITTKMSLQWTLIASVLYIEVGIVLLLVLPIATPSRWQQIFKTRLLRSLGKRASLYCITFLSIIALFMMDAIRESANYSNLEHGQGLVLALRSWPCVSRLEVEMQSIHSNLFVSLFSTIPSLLFINQKMLFFQGNMRLVRAQRNVYLSGFSLFLCLVIRRLVNLISTQATLAAQEEIAMRHAQLAWKTSRNLSHERNKRERAYENVRQVAL